MNVNVPAGKYVVAVSGGVDSVVLLDVLRRQQNLDLVVAHFDHGIRRDSEQDKKFVEALSKNYDLPFEYANGNLGAGASEDLARQARYKFLRTVKTKHKADKIITAHHQDDVLETILINVMRGTGRRGLSSLQSNDEVLRPLLHISKDDIKKYATKNKIAWREDPTNQDSKYTRNWIRINLTPKLTPAQKQQLLNVNQKAAAQNEELEKILQITFNTHKSEIIRSELVNLPYAVACEVMADWLRNNDIRDFDSKAVERLVIGAKTLSSGKSVEIKKDAKMLIEKDALKIIL